MKSSMSIFRSVFSVTHNTHLIKNGYFRSLTTFSHVSPKLAARIAPHFWMKTRLRLSHGTVLPKETHPPFLFKASPTVWCVRKFPVKILLAKIAIRCTANVPVMNWPNFPDQMIHRVEQPARLVSSRLEKLPGYSKTDVAKRSWFILFSLLPVHFLHTCAEKTAAAAHWFGTRLLLQRANTENKRRKTTNQ